MKQRNKGRQQWEGSDKLDSGKGGHDGRQRAAKWNVAVTAIPSVVMALLEKAYGDRCDMLRRWRDIATMARARLRLNLEYKHVTSISGPWGTHREGDGAGDNLRQAGNSDSGWRGELHMAAMFDKRTATVGGGFWMEIKKKEVWRGPNLTGTARLGCGGARRTPRSLHGGHHRQHVQPQLSAFVPTIAAIVFAAFRNTLCVHHHR